MRTPPVHAVAAAALAIALAVVAAPAAASDAGSLDFAGAKAQAAESGKLLLVDFSSPT